jgi:hypothetical protein
MGKDRKRGSENQNKSQPSGRNISSYGFTASMAAETI